MQLSRQNVCHCLTELSHELVNNAFSLSSIIIRMRIFWQEIKKSLKVYGQYGSSAKEILKMPQAKRIAF